MNIKRMAIIEKGVVINVATVDVDSDWSPGKDQTAIESEEASTGWILKGKKLINPNKEEGN